jgi:hypothetical protein
MKRVYFFVACCIALVSCNSNSADQAATKDTTSMAQAKPPAPAEFADMKYADMVKKSSAQLSSGDIDGWLTQFSDSARYLWSSGDSLVGKAAIAKYWKDRRANVIDSISFDNSIYLPIKVNQPQSVEAPGIWVLGWTMVHVKYKNGKKLVFWEHIDFHFNGNDLVDQQIAYLDRAPINAALKK